MQTTITPLGELTQELFIQETRLAAVISTLLLPTRAALTMTVGTPFTVTLPAATGGVFPYTYSVTGAPPGLTFDPATRVLSGTPT